MFGAVRDKAREDMIGQPNPLHRGGQPIEIARAIAFLASEEASYINGHALVVGAGLSSSLPFAKPRKLGQSSF
jgi:NAD(P)-dependent dehydrogenase (short-subunit alcohol dehydrogenase family)